MNIKLPYAILLLIGVAMLAVGGTLLFTQQASEQTPAPSQEYQWPPPTQTPAPTPQIDKPYFSSNEVIAIVSNDKENGFNLWLKTATTPEDLGIDADSARWKALYLGEGKWKVRLVFTNVEGVWYFYEKSRTVQFWGRLRL